MTRSMLKKEQRLSMITILGGRDVYYLPRPLDHCYDSVKIACSSLWKLTQIYCRDLQMYRTWCWNYLKEGNGVDMYQCVNVLSGDTLLC